MGVDSGKGKISGRMKRTRTAEKFFGSESKQLSQKPSGFRAKKLYRLFFYKPLGFIKRDFYENALFSHEFAPINTNYENS